MQTFQKPLTPEEEQLYLKRYRDGDLAARNMLVERNLRLVAHIARKYQTAEEDMEDLISIGTIGLLKAVSTFDMTKGSKLATYAARCIDNELLMMFRSRRKNVREVSLYDPIGSDREGNEIHLLDILESTAPDVPVSCEKKEDTLRLYWFLENGLAEQERTIMILRYGLYGQKPTTQRVIAKRLGISRSYVSRIEKNVLGKFRQFFLSA
ncbi:MAG: RNA polymerase sporulation sigma factor SigK [Lachnospiraceae bacterium]|nr:RNA polymerase sporulation sigma factor SigK [Lachnospiraceae bacterium]